MLGSPLLGTAVGLVLLFAATALLCSGITETLSNVLQLRAKYLLTGMRTLLDGPETAADDRTPKKRKDTLHDRVKKPALTQKARGEVYRPSAQPAPGAATPPAVSDPVTTALWTSPLLTSLQSRRIGVLSKGKLRNPQYVSGRTFARALVDLLVPVDPQGTVPVVTTIGDIRRAVQRLDLPAPLRDQLLAFLARAGTGIDAFERAIEQWYDEQMAKIAGWYKRWSRVVLGIVGFVVAVLANVDTVQVTHALYVDAPLQQAVSATANVGTLCQGVVPADRDTCVTKELDTLNAAGLPLGYTASCDWFTGAWRACWAWSDDAPPDGWDPWRKLAGWVITAFAVSFGAPFWFEALSRLGSLRNTGTKPASSA